ncbi:hypothetical protein FACS1894156_6940 [Bacteroidia bacterium]|nr:hypothetical protein FACS1894156_6940 [Bacteroidia bacterium]
MSISYKIELLKVSKSGEIGIKHLKADGDFRSPECIKLLQQADIVVTNPPFSLFREFVDTLVEYDNKFLIIGLFFHKVVLKNGK